MLKKHRVIEYERTVNTNNAGMSTITHNKVGEYYALLIPAKEVLEVKAFGETKNVTHRLFCRFRTPQLGNIVEIGGDKYMVIAVRQGLGNALVEVDLEWQKQ